MTIAPRAARPPAALPSLVLLLLLAAAGTAAESGSDVHTPIPGTGAQLVVPEGFRVARDFPGIGRDEDLTSLLVTELDVPVAVSLESFDEEGLAQRGIRVDRIVRVDVDGRTGWLAHATQAAAGLVFRKWILLLGDDTRSVMLTATTPLDLESVHQRALVDTLRSARWSPGVAPDGDAGDEAAVQLPFRIEEVDPLRIVKSSANAVVLSDLGAAGDGRVPPLVTVGASLARVQIHDLPGFARSRLEESPSIEAIEIEAETARDLDGMPGWEIRAHAKDTATQRPVAVTQLLASDGARYFLVQGIADAEAPAGFAQLLERVIAGFQRTDGP